MGERKRGRGGGREGRREGGKRGREEEGGKGEMESQKREGGDLCADVLNRVIARQPPIVMSLGLLSGSGNTELRSNSQSGLECDKAHL